MLVLLTSEVTVRSKQLKDTASNYAIKNLDVKDKKYAVNNLVVPKTIKI